MPAIKFSYRLFNPNFWHVIDAFNDINIRYIDLIGGSSSAKTYSVVQAILVYGLKQREDTLIFRKVGASIEKSIFKDFKQVIKDDWNLGEYYAIKDSKQEHKITCLLTGSVIDFSGLDDPERIKGIAGYKRVVLEEISEFELFDWKQVRKRLRGREGQQIVSMLNPISELHWFKVEVIDKEDLTSSQNYLSCVYDDEGKLLPPEYTTIKSKQYNKERTVFNPKSGNYEILPPDTVVLQSTYLNNFWIVGSPDGSYGFYDVNVIADFDKDKTNDPDWYEIYALGEWGNIRTGGEFWKHFKVSKHVSKVDYDPSLPVHISIDNNRLPYIAISIWQFQFDDLDGIIITKCRQIAEIPAEDPYNTVTSAAKLTVKWLNEHKYSDKVYLYGDQTTTAGNTIDDDKLSFFDKFINGIEEGGYIVENRLPSSNPSVSLTAEFINSIYNDEFKDISIEIDDSCKTSINDYKMAKQDVNGGVLKKRIRNKITGQSYEEYGHFSDVKRYVISSVLKERYTSFALTRNRSNFKENNLRYFNSETFIIPDNPIIYSRICPDVNGLFIYIECILVENRIYLNHVIYCDDKNVGVSLAIDRINSAKQVDCIFEGNKTWFPLGREIRDKINSSIRIISDSVKKESRIIANRDFIEKNLYFNDKEKSDHYVVFMQNLYDSYKNSNIEAANILSGMAEFLRKEYRELFKD